MDKIKIITDGSCDLSHEVLNKFIRISLFWKRKVILNETKQYERKYFKCINKVNG